MVGIQREIFDWSLGTLGGLAVTVAVVIVAMLFDALDLDGEADGSRLFFAGALEGELDGSLLLVGDLP